MGGKPSDCWFINAKHGKGSVSHQWKRSWHFQMHLLSTNLGFQRKMTPDERDVLSLGSNGKVGWKLNIQTFEARGAMSGPGSCTPTAASCGEIRNAHRTTQVKPFISLFTLICRSVLWAKKDGDRQTDRCCHLCAYGVSLSYADPCQRWRVVSVTPCLRCTTLTVSSHSASSTSTLQYWLTSDDFADTLQ